MKAEKRLIVKKRALFYCISFLLRLMEKPQTGGMGQENVVCAPLLDERICWKMMHLYRCVSPFQGCIVKITTIEVK